MPNLFHYAMYLSFFISQFLSDGTGEFETARDVQRDLRLISLLDSEALEIQKKLNVVSEAT